MRVAHCAASDVSRVGGRVLARRRYTRVTKVYPFRRSDPSASRLSSAVDLCGAHSVDVTECALPSFARSKMLKPIRSIFSIQVHVHVRYSVLAFVTGLCLRDARPPAAYAAQTANPSWANLMANLHAAASPSWTANVVVHRRRRTIELQLACTSVAHIRRQRTPLCTLASVGSASGMAAPVRGGGAPCAAFDSRLPIRENRQVTSAGRRGRPIFIQVHKMSRLTLVCI